ncbi:MAG TPA: toll/interleukin-1 receptor domain-containing protein [Candidatus Sulfotelmatobacter sp.]|jgi:hypothetical protein|nr:toll/interleukin-1 receptor domain-containing protein [Candidatus Sulfotelmatobacter sp.]
MSRPVFVIYAPDDRDTAEIVAAALVAVGVQPDMDWELDTGGQWSEAMDKALDASDGCVLVLGPDGLGAAGSLDMRLSLARLAGRGAPVAAILLPGASTEDAPLFLQNHPLLDLRQDPDFDGLPRMLRDYFDVRRPALTAKA